MGNEKRGKDVAAMKKSLLIFSFLLTLLLSGCEQNNQEINGFYTMPDQETTMAALLFLGGKTEMESNIRILQEQYFSSIPNQWPKKVETVETEDWQETYLLLPKYPGTVISVYKLSEEELPIAELISTENPVLLRCNRSDMMPSTEVKVHYRNHTVTFRPHISLKDGSCEAAEGIYTQAIAASIVNAGGT